MARVVSERASQRGDILRERVVPNDDLTPDGTQELVFLDDAPGALDERDERVGSFGGEDDEFVVLVERTPPSVEPVGPKAVIDSRRIR
jgi:hypothetical protein